MNHNALQGLELELLNWFAARDWHSKAALVEVLDAFTTKAIPITPALDSLQAKGFIIFNGESYRLTASCIDFLRDV